jgi:hypothetical protein
MVESISQSRRWTFSLRALFVAVALLCGWLAHEASIANNRRAMRRQIELAGGAFSRVYNISDVMTLRHIAPITPVPPISPVRQWMGDRVEGIIAFGRPLTDADRAALSAFPEADVYFREPFETPDAGGPSGAGAPAAAGVR